MSIDLYRALNRTDWIREFCSRLAQAATSLSQRPGVPIGKEQRIASRDGGKMPVTVNVYDRAILDEAMRAIGPA